MDLTRFLEAGVDEAGRGPLAGPVVVAAAEIKPDWISGLLIVLLIATLWAFFSGAFPYPYGWIVLMALLVMRLTAKQDKQ